jgi:hypothetical protein
MPRTHRNRSTSGDGIRRAEAWGWAVVAIVAALAFGGCSNRLQRLEGRVLVDGQPAMEGVQVFLYAQGSHWSAQGRVGPDGKFAMATNLRTGVMKGKYKVVLINSFESLKAASFSQEEMEAAQREGRPPKGWGEYQEKINAFLKSPPSGSGWIPKVYADLSTTPLTLEVPGARNPVTIEVPSASPETAGSR